MSAGWILVRGLARHAVHWNGLERGLASALETTTACLDLPGNGARHLERSPLSVERMAEQIRAQAPPRDGKRHSLLGISLGAMVCLEWASRWPWEIDRLVVINTSVGNLCPPHRRLRPAAARAIASIVATADPVRRELATLALTSRAHVGNRELAQRFAEAEQEQPMAKANVLRQLAAASRFRVGVAPPGVRILVLRSLQDDLVDPVCSGRLARHLGARCIEHPEAGHDLPLDAPRWCVDQIRGWA